MNPPNEKNEGTQREGKAESPERRKFFQRFLGLGALAFLFRPVWPGNPPPPPPVSKKADFWRKGDRLAG